LPRVLFFFVVVLAAKPRAGGQRLRERRKPRIEPRERF
jgi:hypothetical protein